MIINETKEEFKMQLESDDLKASIVVTLLESAEHDFQIDTDEDGNPYDNVSMGNFDTMTILRNIKEDYLVAISGDDQFRFDSGREIFFTKIAI